jgi:hypothetical protein
MFHGEMRTGGLPFLINLPGYVLSNKIKYKKKFNNPSAWRDTVLG